MYSSTVSADRTPHTTDLITLPVGHWHEYTLINSECRQDTTYHRPDYTTCGSLAWMYSSTVSADRTPHTTNLITLPVGHWHECTLINSECRQDTTYHWPDYTTCGSLAWMYTHQQWVQTGHHIPPTWLHYLWVTGMNVHSSTVSADQTNQANISLRKCKCTHSWIHTMSLSLFLSHTHTRTFSQNMFSSSFSIYSTHTHTQTHTRTYTHTHTHTDTYSDWLKYKSLQMTTVCIYSHFQMTNAHVLHVLCNMQDARFIKFWLIKHTVTWPTYLTTPHKLLTSQCAKINKCIYHYSLNNKKHHLKMKWMLQGNQAHFDIKNSIYWHNTCV